MALALHNQNEVKLKLRPLADVVVVLRDEAVEETTGGIVLPEQAREKTDRGKVVAVGEGKWNNKGNRILPQVKPGDNVIFGKYGGDAIKLDDVEYLLLRESDILAVLSC